MKDWREITLGDFVRVQRGYDLPERERREGTVPVMGSAGQSGTHDVALTRGPGIVIGRSGASYGVVSWCNEDFWPLNTTLFVTDFLGNHPRFAYYFLRTLDLSGYNVGSAQPSLNRNHIYPIPVAVPEPEEQHRIADLLGALDDKIALNRRMSRTLAATAAALFRSWFVDFDPVLAKSEGRRAVGVLQAVHEAMPNGFTDSEEGPLPLGWNVGAVGAEFNVRMGQSPPGTSYNEIGDGVPFYQGCTDFGFRYPKRRLFTTAPSRFADAQDTLVSVRAPVGRVNMASERCCIGRGLAAVRHRSGSRSYTYYAMRALEERFAVFEGEGTLFGAITRDGFTSLPVLVPPPDVVAAFEDLCHPLDERISVNEREITTLATLRDTLLPQLLTGTIRLRDVERAVATAV